MRCATTCIEQDALPDAPLIAMVPVSLRSEEDADAGGNLVGSILCNLATDVEDPAQRIEAISESMRNNKKVFAELPRMQVLALSALNMAPLTLAGVPGFISSTPPPFNLVISNVPGLARADVLRRRAAGRQLSAVGASRTARR